MFILKARNETVGVAYCIQDQRLSTYLKNIVIYLLGNMQETHELR